MVSVVHVMGFLTCLEAPCSFRLPLPLLNAPSLLRPCPVLRKGVRGTPNLQNKKSHFRVSLDALHFNSPRGR